ncbi:MAG: PAS domain S-box protein [Bacteroidetes bacterium]|nr:PAS domain S-box protein [Bacteroidota bacterium]
MLLQPENNVTSITKGSVLYKQIGYLNAIIENSFDAIVTRGMDHKIITWNKGAEKLFGFTKGQALGRRARDMGWVRFSKAVIEEVDHTLQHEGTWKSEQVFYHSNGNRFIGAVTAHRIYDDNKYECCEMFIIRDITLQKQFEEQLLQQKNKLEQEVSEKNKQLTYSENRFRAMIENNAEAIVLIDQSGVIFFRSAAAERLTGWTNEEAMQPGFFQKVIYREDREKFLGFIAAAMQNPGKIIPTSYRSTHKDGNIQHMEGTLVNLLQNEEVHGIVFNAKDVTERIQKEQELDIRKKQIQAREQLLELFIKHSPASIAMFDNQMRYMVVSPRWLKDYNLVQEDITGKSHYDVFPEIGEEWKRVHQRCLRGGHLKKEEDKFVRPNGNVQWLRWEIVPWRHTNGVIGGIIIFTEDITERKTAAEVIQKSETQYRTLVERISDGFIALDKDYCFTFINKAGEEMLSRPAQLLTGKNIWHEFPEAVHQIFYEACARAMRTQKYISTEGFSYAANRWVHINIYPSPTGLSVFFRDINLQKEAALEAEKNKKEAEKNDLIRKKIMAAALDAIIYIDKKGNVIAWNEQAEKVFGWKAEEITGKNIVEKLVPSQYPKIHSMGFDDYSKTAGAQLMLNTIVEKNALHRSGKIFPVEFFIVPIDQEDDLYYCAFARDITERKESEIKLLNSLEQQEILTTRFSAIINALPANIALLDKEGFIIEVNEAWKTFSTENQYTGNNFCIGDNYISIALGAGGNESKDGQKVANGIRKVLNRTLNEFVHEYPSHSTEKERWFRMVVTPINSGHEPGVVVMHIDISELRRLEKERMQEQLEEQRKISRVIVQAQEKERTAIGIELHDNLNQLLAGINIYLSLAQKNESKSGEYIQNAMTSIQEAIVQSRKLSHELVTPDFSAVKLQDMIDKLGKIMLENAGITVTLNAKRCNEKPLTNEHKLAIYRIAQEQCNNIIKYAQANNVNIILNTTSRAFTMIITDDGVGMEKNQTMNGIGMNNIRSRLSIFNGKVEIISAPGKGFTLGISIPMKANKVEC